jgi:hypothetical protein
MDPPRVCAVVYAETADATTDEVGRAAAAQSVRPSEVLVESTLAAGARAGRALSCEWIWLLDGYAIPEQAALEAMLFASQAGSEPQPVLLASKIVDPRGALHPDALPRHEIREKVHSVEAVERHLVQLRAAGPGSVLISASAIARVGPPRSDLPAGLDMHEWSARILRSWEDVGYLVPGSVAVRRTPPCGASPGYWLARARVLGSEAWGPTERLWELFLLGRDAAVAIRARDRGQGRGGVGARGFSPSRSPRRMIGIEEGAKRLKRR